LGALSALTDLTSSTGATFKSYYLATSSVFFSGLVCAGAVASTLLLFGFFCFFFLTSAGYV
jgi:hypothetical protein